MNLSEMFKTIITGIPSGYYETYEKAVEAQIDCDPEYQGETGLMRAYEDYAEEIGEKVINGKTYYFYKHE